MHHLAAPLRKEKAKALAESGELRRPRHQGKIMVGDLELDATFWQTVDDSSTSGYGTRSRMRSGGGTCSLRAVQRKGLDPKSMQSCSLRSKIHQLQTTDPGSGHGYDADVLVEICKAVVGARDAANSQRPSMG